MLHFPSSFYGRRKGRPLGTLKSHLMAEILPSYTLNPKAIDFLSQPTWLEIGFGSGEHLAYQAEHNPHVRLLGIEVFYNGIATLVHTLRQKDLQNVLIYPDTVQTLLPSLTLYSFEKLFILFPDPWPKKRQRKRRLIRRDSFETFASLLKAAGQFYFASDHQDYINEVQSFIEKSILFKDIQVFTQRPSTWPLTCYNRKAEQEGRKSWYIIATRQN